MAVSVGRAELDLGLNYNSFKKELNGIKPGAESMLKGAFGALGKVAAVAGIASFTAKAAYEFGKMSISIASDLAEVQNVVDVTFGSMAKQINDFSSTALKQFGLSELSAKKYASTMGAMLKSSGLTGQKVTDMSVEMAKLTADMASFYNLDTDEAFNKIRAGISGETEPLKQLGINLNVANLEAYALTQGITKSYQEMTQAEQVLLRYNYLLKVSADSQGDFARNSGSWANQTKILKEQWKEFMGLIGKALIEILLPFVKMLNELLSILINVAKELGKIYSLMTGKEVVVETNNSITDAAEDAAIGEAELADGIKKAGKEAKKALAPIDELNILQTKLGSGGSGDGLFDGISGDSTGKINTVIQTKQVDEGPDKSKWQSFFIWFRDNWIAQQQMLSIPIRVPAPVFAKIPSPVYNPEWNLTPPFVPKPVFQPIPNPVYNPNWNLVPPPIPKLVLNPIDYQQYSISLEAIKNDMRVTKAALELSMVELLRRLSEETANAGKKMELNFAKHWQTVQTNFNTHKANMSAIATATSTVLIANINKGLSTVGSNINKSVTTFQTNLQTFGKNAGAIASSTAQALSNNIKSGLETAHRNIISFANSASTALKTFGSNMLAVSASAAKGFVSNIVSGLQTAWDNFKKAASAMGEKVSGWFSANKQVITTTLIVGGVALGATALALAAPAIIPYAAAALGGLASVPALAKGGIVDGPTLAMVGEAGKEVVMPLENNTGWINDLALKIAGIMGYSNQSNNGQPIYLTVKIGEQTLLEYLIDAMNRQSRINGETIFEV